MKRKAGFNVGMYREGAGRLVEKDIYICLSNRITQVTWLLKQHVKQEDR